MLRIPSAVSLRLDAMVSEVRAGGFSAYRHEVVGVLVVAYAPSSDAGLVKNFNDYRKAKVKDLVTPGVSLRNLLKDVPPAQGPRPR